MKNTYLKLIIILGVVLVLLACSVSFDDSGGSDLEKTQIALGVQATSLALEREQNGQANPNNEEQNNANEPQAGGEQIAPTYTPLPTYTPYPTEEAPPAAPAATEAPPPTAAPSTLSMDERIRQSNVLIYEDVWGHPVLSGDRRIDQAVQMVGFSGGRVVKVGDAMGDFKAQLLSGTQWDLIIVGSERKDSIQGEFWPYIMDHLNRDTAFIADIWYVYNTQYGKIAPVLSACGISAHKDWGHSGIENVLDYSVLNLDTTHPIFNTPNSGVSLVTPNMFWIGDVGDMLKLSAGGDARLLAGLYYGHTSDYGVIAECMEGKVIFQTFDTHNYRRDQTVPLWQNYIVYTLTNHYNAIDGN